MLSKKLFFVCAFFYAHAIAIDNNASDSKKPTVLLVLGSVREGRMADPLAQAVHALIDTSKINVRIADLKQYNLPFINLEDPVRTESMNQWANDVKSADALILLVPNYNNGYSAVLKNAIDVLNHEGHNKFVALIGYAGGYVSENPLKTLVPTLESIGMRPLVNSLVVIQFITSALDEFNRFKKVEDRQTIENLLRDLYNRLGVA
ncbi:MAG: FMN-dependent NADPH-azoreductase [Candidatus Dependentiae bacterium ADurb.Bin331]|nr:MAG: FMN-dependent NADPH-azoreductase [Candidatus Dependentiae bacterium ADurb.Bin331]